MQDRQLLSVCSILCVCEKQYTGECVSVHNMHLYTSYTVLNVHVHVHMCVHEGTCT